MSCIFEKLDNLCVGQIRHYVLIFFNLLSYDKGHSWGFNIRNTKLVHIVNFIRFKNSVSLFAQVSFCIGVVLNLILANDFFYLFDTNSGIPFDLNHDNE